MNCEHVRDLLSAYLDNQLAEPERQNVASHLAVCPECNAILADYRRFDALLAQIPRIEAPSSLRISLFNSEDYRQLHNGHVQGSTLMPSTPLPGAPFTCFNTTQLSSHSQRRLTLSKRYILIPLALIALLIIGRLIKRKSQTTIKIMSFL